ncbi:MAG: replication-relaxation family protein [Actinobacteria bacterium]|nr:replication-relaxation family protein [Actinomycetota bacterium]
MSGRGGLPEATPEILASLASHRALSAAQVGEIHMPEAGARRVRSALGRIATAGLADHTRAPGPVRSLWFATEEGIAAAVTAGALPRPLPTLTARQVRGRLRSHTFAVNEAAIAFLRSARERGEDFGPLAWRPEVAHPLRPGTRGRRARAVIADALLTYLRLTEQEVLLEQRFLELDRATLPVDAMAAELARYAELFRATGKGGTPVWRSRYPVFPGVICVLAGASREALGRRRDTALALLRAEPWLTLTPEVGIRMCLLEDLVERGPFAPIFHGLREPGREVDWLGREGEG